MTRTKKQLFQGLRIFFLCIVCLIALAPFYVAVCYAFKSKVEIAKTKLAFPTTLYLGNFTEAVGLANYFNSFKNSVIVAAFAILIVVVICSMAAYIITRRNDRFYNTMYYIFQLIILLPFQTIMFPLYRQLYQIHALNSLWGLVLVQAGTFVGYNVFLYSGFVKGISYSLEEAAKIDGASVFQRIKNIDLPELLPMAILNLIMAAGGLMNVGFEKVWLLQTDLNKATSDVIAVYVYQQGIENAKYSYSTAVGLFNTAVNIILLLIVNKIASKASDVEFV